MVNPFTELLAAGDADARAMLAVPGVFARRGEIYARAQVIMAPAEGAMVFAAGGAELRVKGLATVRKDAMVQPPAEGDTLTAAERRFFVVQVESSPQDPVWSLTLAS